MKYGIAIFPSKKVQDVVNSYRKRYDPHYALIPPHITLKEGFEAEDNEIDQLIKDIRDVARSIEPFTIKIDRVSSFQPVTNTIYLKIETTDELIDLNKKLHSGKFPKDQTFSYVPHITIAQKLSQDEHSDVYGSLRMLDFNIEEKIDRFQLLYQLENGSWTVYETFSLGK